MKKGVRQVRFKEGRSLFCRRNMNKKILDILEFDKVKQLFEPYLQTEQGEMELAALTPTDKKKAIETAFMELEDMEQILLEEPRFAVSTIQDVRPVAKRLEMEASLNIDELLALKAVLRVTHELKDFYDNLENVRLERLNRLFDNLVDLPRLQGGLQAINEGGFVESLPVKNWPKFVVESRKMNTRSERFYKTC